MSFTAQVKKQAIIAAIKDFIVNNHPSTRYPDWYVGITKNPKGRLSWHKVKRGWIYRQASGEQMAREIESHFLRLGLDGGKSGGDEETVFVYAYLKKSSTQETA